MGSGAAELGAQLLLSAPVIGVSIALGAWLVGWLLAREARKRATFGARPRRIESSASTHQMIALYRFRPGTVDTVTQRVERELVRLFRRREGFVAYHLVRTGEDEAVSVSTWSSREQAEAAVDTSVQWVTGRVPHTVIAMENHVGAVVVHNR